MHFSLPESCSFAKQVTQHTGPVPWFQSSVTWVQILAGAQNHVFGAYTLVHIPIPGAPNSFSSLLF
jgi:hypothetical protein